MLKEYLYKNNVITLKNRINKNLGRPWKRDILNKIIEETSFLPEKSSSGCRIFCILNEIKEIPKCQVCGIKDAKFQRDFPNGYFKYCSKSCANSIGSSKLRRSEETRKYQGKRISEKRRINGTYNISFESRKKQSTRALTKETQERKKKTNLIRYGVENPGVLGAYNSKAGYLFIKKYINENNIDEKKCYFYNGGVNSKEFYQNIFNDITKKYDYVSYDLVVFKTIDDAKNKNLKEIDFVLEYNGPWHYTYEEVCNDPNSPETPYNKIKTKKESYDHDIKKYKLMLNYTNKIYIYWEKTKKFEILNM
jgi:hypothetical protein